LIEVRHKIPLDKNEGIYIRDIRTGIIRSVMDESYLLKAHEELWDKELGESVERLLYGS